ncbi:hypothetical protein EGR_01897 [Echinococcus granulosus]|uniref:Uncharacterized protein n=1 Tax=Echinococcus granulosus TaxID=6210 RepID=W6URT9_ECHGR|nr:hypothetical protein EGR_01897 [Echinococcus granulosus]EUB63406.1 hypothetical protein EGR_01897 [Echinococcus granulosus]
MNFSNIFEQIKLYTSVKEIFNKTTKTVPYGAVFKKIGYHICFYFHLISNSSLTTIDYIILLTFLIFWNIILLVRCGFPVLYASDAAKIHHIGNQSNVFKELLCFMLAQHVSMIKVIISNFIALAPFLLSFLDLAVFNDASLHKTELIYQCLLDTHVKHSSKNVPSSPLSSAGDTKIENFLRLTDLVAH